MKRYLSAGMVCATVDFSFFAFLSGEVCDSPVAASYCLMNDEYKGVFVMLGEQFTKEEYGIVVNKGNRVLLDKINKGIEAFMAKGMDEQLKNKWFH